MKPGEALQILVAALERTSEQDPRFTVESPKRLKDVVTGQLREHDVVLTFRHLHHETVTALECRDRSRPIGVPDVEQFAAKCQRTGVHRACMVSTKGFAKTALKTAATLNVLCLSLHEAKAFSWLTAPGLVVETMSFVSLAINFVSADTSRQGDFAQLIDISGEPIPTEVLANVVLQGAQQNGHHFVPGRNVISGSFNGIQAKVRFADGEIRDIQGGSMTLTLDVLQDLAPWKLHTYGPAESVGRSFATAEVPGGRIVFARQDDGSTTVNMVVDPPPRNSPEPHTMGANKSSIK